MKSIMPSSSSGPLRLLIPLPGMFFPQVSARLLPSPPLFSTLLSPYLHSISFNDVYNGSTIHGCAFCCISTAWSSAWHRRQTINICWGKKISDYWILAQLWRCDGYWQVLHNRFKKQTKQTKQGQVMLMYQLCPLPREFNPPMWRSRCLCQQRILPHTARAHQRHIKLCREEGCRMTLIQRDTN